MRAVPRGAAAALVAGLALLPAAPAAAVGAEKAGWWNRLSAGPLTAPAPTAQDGDLRVASGGGDAPTAYAAVLFRAAGATEATLDLQVRPDSVLGTVEVVACPTADTDWAAGGNQPIAAAPAYDCDRGLAFGSLSEDGTTLSFLLDGSQQLTPGTWSLALVPQPDSTAGAFAVDLQAPGPDALTPAEADATAPDTGTAPAEPAPDAGAADRGVDGGTGTAEPPPLTSGFDAPLDVPALDGGTAAAPLLAGDVEAPLADAAGPGVPGPAVAGEAPLPAAAAAPPVTFRPAAVTADDVGTAPRLLALLLLVGGSAAVGYAAGQSRTSPRLIGGRARLASPAGAPVPETGAEPAARQRGIGRFARERDTAPRRLR